MRKIKQLIIHHTAGRLSDTPEMVREWHRAKGFTDRAGKAGYHFFIMSNGFLFPERPVEEMGCHTKNFNANSIGICLMGDFRRDQPTDAQVETLVALLISLVLKYDLKFWNIYPHRDIKKLFIFNTTATNCCGENLIRLLPDIRRRVAFAIAFMSWAR